MNTTSVIRFTVILSVCLLGINISAQELRSRTRGSDEIGGFKAKTLEVIYVDNQSAAGGTGSKADPVDTIQQGVDKAAQHGATIVVVRGGKRSYVEDVTIDNPKGLSIYGDGKNLPCAKGVENPYAGNGPLPELEGGIYVDGIPFFDLFGLTVVGGFAGVNGVELFNVNEARVIGNEVRETGIGALFAAGIIIRGDGNLNGNYTVSCNLIEDNDVLGVALIVIDDTQIIGRFDGNDFISNMGTALRLQLNGTSKGDFRAKANSIVGNGVFGFGITAGTFEDSEGAFEILDNLVEQVGHEGFALSAIGDSLAKFEVSGNTITSSGGTGAAVQAQNQATVECDFFDNEVSANSNGGLLAQTSADGVIDLILNDNRVASNGTHGFRFVESAGGDMSVTGTDDNDTFPGNGGNEVESSGNPDGFFILNAAVVFLPTTIP